eukprot:jgi/Botrbrau1/144/Bobra.0022s0129.1
MHEHSSCRAREGSGSPGRSSDFPSNSLCFLKDKNPSHLEFCVEHHCTYAWLGDAGVQIPEVKTLFPPAPGSTALPS